MSISSTSSKFKVLFLELNTDFSCCVMNVMLEKVEEELFPTPLI